jgi:predicted O-methyltransferase YrrM
MSFTRVAALDDAWRHAEEAGVDQKREELDRLGAFLLEYHALRPIRRVLEIGSLYGGMLTWFRYLFDPLLVSVDLDGPPIAGCIRIIGDSHDPAIAARAADLGSYDLVHIDGDHTLAGATDDWQTYGAMASSPGLVVLHDILPRHPAAECEVDVLWHEIVASGAATHEFTTPVPHWGGIGVVCKG